MFVVALHHDLASSRKSKCSILGAMLSHLALGYLFFFKLYFKHLLVQLSACTMIFLLFKLLR